MNDEARSEAQLMHDERGGLSADLFALVATVLMAYGTFWILYEYLFPLEESILLDVVVAIRSPFIDAFGPTRGATVFLVVVLVLGLLLNVAIFIMDRKSTADTEQISQDGGNQGV